ncbi:MAG TPA: GNAT family N-acetyltransferase [Gemmatimonadaceae bacterium]
MSGARGDVRVAPLAASHHAAARALLAGERPAELLERASTGTAECVALAATRDGALLGVALYGEVSGTRHTGALLWLAVRPDARRRGIARLLLDGALAKLGETGTRLVVAELADDDAHAGMRALLAAGGFALEGTVPDYYRDGVALSLWSRRPE